MAHLCPFVVSPGNFPVAQQKPPGLLCEIARFPPWKVSEFSSPLGDPQIQRNLQFAPQKGLNVQLFLLRKILFEDIL